MADYLPIFMLMVLAIGFAAVSYVGSKLLGPSKRTLAKEAPYECGIVPTKEPAERFPVRFYLVAMIFIIFDIEIIFLYPWAVIYRRDLGTFGLIEMIVFAVAVFVSFVYLISNGALDWGPVKRLRPEMPVDVTGGGRTSASTVRRVSRPAAGEDEPGGGTEEAA